MASVASAASIILGGANLTSQSLIPQRSQVVWTSLYFNLGSDIK